MVFGEGTDTACLRTLERLGTLAITPKEIFMPKAFTRVVTWISRGKRRHGSAVDDIVPPQHSNMSAGDTFQPNWAAPSISWVDGNHRSHTANFAFWSVTGGIGGAIVTTQNTAPPVGVGN